MTFVVSITRVIVSSVIRVLRPFNVSLLSLLHKDAYIKLPTTPEATPIEKDKRSSAVELPSKDNVLPAVNNLSSTSPSQS